MTREEAIAALFAEYDLASFVDVFRDEAKEDTAWCAANPHALSSEYPRVLRFQEICRVLQGTE